MQLLTDRADAYRVSRAEFEEIRDRPDDPTRFELLDGEVLVTPSPSPVHQEIVGALCKLLHPAVPGRWSVERVVLVSRPAGTVLVP